MDPVWTLAGTPPWSAFRRNPARVTAILRSGHVTASCNNIVYIAHLVKHIEDLVDAFLWGIFVSREFYHVAHHFVDGGDN